MRRPPRVLERELRLIHNKYFALLNERLKRWEIRHWVGMYPRWSTWENDSTLVCKYPANHDLNMRDVRELQHGLYNATIAKQFSKKIDDHNEAMAEKADIEDEYIRRYMFKSIYHYFREPTVYGGVSGGNRKHPY
jgi:hypothetical protein